MDKKELTILVVSYDGYSDMWPGFFACFRKYWPDCPYELVLANNQKQCPDPDVRVVNCGETAQWSTRTRTALEQIRTKYVCFLLEDFFLSGQVSTAYMEQALELMRTEKIDYYKLLSFSRINTPSYEKNPALRIIPADLPYGVSLLAAIWEREHFLSLIGDGDYNPWLFEARRIEEAKLAPRNNDTMVGVFDPANPLHICHMAVQGKYLPDAVRKMRGLGVDVDTRSRPVMAGKEYLKYRMKKLGASLAGKSPFIKKIALKLGFESVSDRSLAAVNTKTNA